MSFPIPKRQRELVPEATYIATCVQIIDLGTQDMIWNQRASSVRRLWMTFELPTVRRQGIDNEGVEYDSPALMGREMTQSMGKRATLRQVLESWGVLRAVEQEGGIGALVGTPAMITVAHVEKDDSVYDNIVAIAGIPDGMDVPPVETEMVEYHLDNFDQDLHDSLPEWIREKIEKSDEYRQIALGQKRTQEEVDDDIPF